MNRKFFIVTLLMGWCCLSLCSQTVFVQTFDYAEKDGQPLRMDVYALHTLDENARRPVLIFSFGGSWEGGRREDGGPILEHFAQKGYVAVGIDYRLGIRRLKDAGGKIDSANFASSYGDAILMGIEDLFDATAYVIRQAEEWKADTSRIVLCGSSAGAINSITAEYLLCNHHPAATSRLPKGFSYAAVISCAGGIWLKDTASLEWYRKPCPILAYHGTRDQLVPYGKMLMAGGSFGAFGPDDYLPEVKAMGVSTLMHRYAGTDHAIAGIYWHEGARNEMLDFLFRVLYLKQQLNIDTTEERPDQEPATKTVEDSFKELSHP